VNGDGRDGIIRTAEAAIDPGVRSVRRSVSMDMGPYRRQRQRKLYNRETLRLRLRQRQRGCKQVVVVRAFVAARRVARLDTTSAHVRKMQ
jgi:hypothetical protein